MKKNRKKYHFKINITRIIENGLVSLITGILIAIFSFWLTKTFGSSIFGG